jgi:putative ABC transport system permease protein
MTFIENIRLALTSLRANMMRSILTMLGIIIGISSVITIMTVGAGMTAGINDSLSTLGATNITVYLQPKTSDDDFGNFGSTSMEDDDKITDAMIESLKQRYPNEIDAISLDSFVGGGSVIIDKNEATVSITGINDDYLNTNDIKMIAGRKFIERDMDGARKVAMVTDKFVEKVFNGDDNGAIGQEITVVSGTSYQDYTIIGVYLYETNIAPMMQVNEENVTTSLYIPLSTAKDIVGDSSTGYSSFEIKCKIGVDGLTFSEDVGTYLNKFYKDNANFEITTFSMESMIKEMNTMLGMVQLALSVIAGISLLVGGIGVMNIMLVSVSERTKEIGTRKALGATNKDIRLQFVTESIIVCIVGGFIGIVLGGSLGYIFSNYIGSATLPTINSVIIAFGFSLAIGVFFGYYPADRAARLNPIDALRYE